MLLWILGALGVTGVAAVVIYGLTAFGILGALKLPAFLVNAAALIVEFMFRVLSWFGTTFGTGEMNIWSTWQGLFAQCVVAFVCALWGKGPLLALLTMGAPHLPSMPSFSFHWPWHSAAQTEEASPDSLLSSGTAPTHHFRHAPKMLPKKSSAPSLDNSYDLRHQLG